MLCVPGMSGDWYGVCMYMCLECSIGPSKRTYVPAGNTGAIAATRTTPHPATSDYWTFSSLPRAFTGTNIAGDRHCSTGAIEEILLQGNDNAQSETHGPG